VHYSDSQLNKKVTMVIHKAQAIGGAVARAFALSDGTNNRTHRQVNFWMGLLLILTLAAFNSLLAQDVALKERLDPVIDQALKQDRIVGLTMLVAEDGKVIYRHASGWNDRKAKKPLRSSDVFRLASLTKLIVSVTALALAMAGGASQFMANSD
jgi:Beta-lactamase